MVKINKPVEQTIQPKDSIQTEPINQATPEEIQQTDQELSEPVNEDTATDAIREINGKIRSIGKKAVYIELADGSGFATNINPETSIIIQNVVKSGTLANLKPGQNVTVKADSANNAIETLIKK